VRNALVGLTAALGEELGQNDENRSMGRNRACEWVKTADRAELRLPFQRDGPSLSHLRLSRLASALAFALPSRLLHSGSLARGPMTTIAIHRFSRNEG
jgi:hypothetical protein